MKDEKRNQGQRGNNNQTEVSDGVRGFLMRLPGDAGADAAPRTTRQFDKAAPRWHQLVSFGGRRQVVARSRQQATFRQNCRKCNKIAQNVKLNKTKGGRI